MEDCSFFRLSTLKTEMRPKPKWRHEQVAKPTQKSTIRFKTAKNDDVSSSNPDSCNSYLGTPSFPLAEEYHSTVAVLYTYKRKKGLETEKTKATCGFDSAHSQIIFEVQIKKRSSRVS